MPDGRAHACGSFLRTALSTPSQLSVDARRYVVTPRRTGTSYEKRSLDSGGMDARARALELLDRWKTELTQLLPEGSGIFDAHLHLGHDIDGMVGDYDQLEALMAEYGMTRAFMFCLDEPDRHPSFSAAN